VQSSDLTADFIDLYGVDAANGMQLHPKRFWSCFSGPVSTEADGHRARLLAAYSTIPTASRTRFLKRLHSEDPHLAIGAWAELEFVHFVTESGLSVLWTDEQNNSVQGRRSVDMVIKRHETLLDAEVTHYREEPVPPDVIQVFSIFGKERLPVGVYALTVGEGRPPISRLRAGLKRALATGSSSLLGIHVKGWSIQQLLAQPPAASPEASAMSPQQARFAVLTDRLRRAVKKKRRQVRDAGSRDVLLAIVLLDRNATTFMEFIASQPNVLAPFACGSTSAPSSLGSALAIGAVRSDQFPPVPAWTLALPEGGTGQSHIGIEAPTIIIPRSKEILDDRMLEKQNDLESAQPAVYYATVKVISAHPTSHEATQVAEIQ